MRPGSDWLRRLEQVVATDSAAVPLTCVWSPVDSFVSPAESARRPGGLSLEIGGLGHFGLLRSPVLWQALQHFVRASRAATTTMASAAAATQ